MKVALIGNLVNMAYNITKFLRRRGIEADLLLSKSEIGTSNPVWEDPELKEHWPEWIRFWDDYSRLTWHGRLLASIPKVRILTPIFQLRKYDLIHSFCTASTYSQFTGRPYIATATGSDLRELASENTKAGRRMRRAFIKAKIVFFASDEGHVQQVKKLGLAQAQFLPPIIDTDKYAPFPSNMRKTNYEFTIFHPSRLDWSYQGVDRSSTKGNDRFFKAFARFVKEGYNAFLTIIDLGVDREKTRELIAELGISENVEFVPKMSKNDLIKYYNEADVVIDQFDVGSLGYVALEGMSCAKPVIVYVNTECYKVCYPDLPPVLNARSEDEIYERLLEVSDRARRETIGKNAREWILKYHHWEKVIDKLIFHYETVLGKL